MKDDEIIREQALVLFDRAYKHQMKGEFSTAIGLYERSIAIHPMAEAYTFLGWTYSMINHYQKAIEHHQQSLDIARDIDDRQSERTSLLNLGSCYFSLGDYQKANKHYQ